MSTSRALGWNCGSWASCLCPVPGVARPLALLQDHEELLHHAVHVAGAPGLLDDPVLHPHVGRVLDEGAEGPAQDGLGGRVLDLLVARQLQGEGELVEVLGPDGVEGVPNVGLVVVRKGDLLVTVVEGLLVPCEAPEVLDDGLADEVHHGLLALVGPDVPELAELREALVDRVAVDRQRQGPAVSVGAPAANAPILLLVEDDGHADDEAGLLVVALGPAGAGDVALLGCLVPRAEVELLLAAAPAGDHGVLVAGLAVAAEVAEAQRDGAAHLHPGVARGGRDAVGALHDDAAHLEREPSLRARSRGLTAPEGGSQASADAWRDFHGCRIGSLRIAGSLIRATRLLRRSRVGVSLSGTRVPGGVIF